MRMLSLYSGRPSTLTTRALCIVLVTLVTGCASKNPLMDDSAVTGKNETKPIMTQAPQTAAASASTTNAGTGVQTTKQRRFLGFLSPYRADVQQGNFVSQEMVSQLKEGMTTDQVRFVLGTPLLTDIFHADRWDYVFRLQKGNGEITGSRVSVFFKDNRLARFEGGDLPTEKDYLARLEGAAPVSKPTSPTDAPQPAPSSVVEPK